MTFALVEIDFTTTSKDNQNIIDKKKVWNFDTFNFKINNIMIVNFFIKGHK